MKSALLTCLLFKILIFGSLYHFFKTTYVNQEIRQFVFVPEGATRNFEIKKAQTSFPQRLASMDGQSYLKIAKGGYEFKQDVHNAFFPLFPLIVSAISFVTGNILISGIVLNFTCSFLGLFFIAKILKLCGVNNLILPLLLLLAFPTAGFYNFFYTESLFLFLSSSAIYASMKKKYFTAGLLGFLCGLTRPQGILVAIPIFFEIMSDCKKPPDWIKKPKTYLKFSLSVLPVLGMVSYVAYIGFNTGNFFSIFQVQQTGWNRDYGTSALYRLLTPGHTSYWYDIIGVTFGVSLIPFLFKKLPPSLAFYGLSMVLLPLSTGSFLSCFRFMSVSFPHFLVLSLLLEKRPCFWTAFFTASLFFQMILNKAYMSWEFLV